MLILFVNYVSKRREILQDDNYDDNKNEIGVSEDEINVAFGGIVNK